MADGEWQEREYFPSHGPYAMTHALYAVRTSGAQHSGNWGSEKTPGPSVSVSVDSTSIERSTLIDELRRAR